MTEFKKDFDKDELFSLIISSINDMEKTDYIGSRKKQIVLQIIQLSLGKEAYERYLPFIDITVDGLVSISNDDIKLVMKHTKNIFSRCC